MFYMLAKKYQHYDITVYYKTGDPKQIQRLREYVRVRQYKTGEIIKCEKAFFNFDTDIIDFVEAEEYVEIIHADFKAYAKIWNIKPNVNPKITKYIAVSKVAADAFEELTGIKPEVCYNPLVLDPPKKVLKLITASRLTKEKGRDRMIKLANALDAAGIPYIWTVFTNDKNAILNPNVIYLKPRINGITDFIADADYLVQLSDTEAYSYSIWEALTLGTPVIVTPLPVLKEMGADGTNSIIIDWDVKNVPVDAIYKGLPKFEYTAKKDRWGTIMAKGKSTYQKEKSTLVKVSAIKRYFDIELQTIKEKGEEFETTLTRAEDLVHKGLVNIIK